MAHHFKSDQDGSGTILSIFMSVGLLVGMGVAIDVTNAFRTQKQLQLTSDAEALAATTLVGDQDAAIQRGLDVTARNLKDDIHGGAVSAEDFEFGTFDEEIREFTVSEFPNAVRVPANHDTSRNNSVYTYVVGLIGKDHWYVGEFYRNRSSEPCSGRHRRRVLRRCIHSNTWCAANRWRQHMAG